MKNSSTILLGMLFVCSLFIAPSSNQAQSKTKSPVTFTDVTKAAGINFTSASSTEKKYIVESMNGGVAFFDFDDSNT